MIQIPLTVTEIRLQRDKNAYFDYIKGNISRVTIEFNETVRILKPHSHCLLAIIVISLFQKDS